MNSIIVRSNKLQRVYIMPERDFIIVFSIYFIENSAAIVRHIETLKEGNAIGVMLIARCTKYNAKNVPQQCKVMIEN